MKSGTEEHDMSMLRAAQLYYEMDLTQDEIAKKLMITRWKVGRLLHDAKNAGVVRIEIVHPRARRHVEESQLKERFGLADAVVVPFERNAAEQRRAVARAAAEFLCDVRPTPKVVGISWGRTLDDVAAAMPPGWTRGVEVVQINGAVSRSRRPSSGGDVATEIARQGAGTVSLLAAPAIVERARTREALESDPSISGVLKAGRDADVLLFSLGALSMDSVLVEAGYVSENEVKRLISEGAQGDILGRFIDSEGREVDVNLEKRTIALTLENVRKAKYTIAVASGSAKAEMARTAAASGLCMVLVTDLEIANYLLESA